MQRFAIQFLLFLGVLLAGMSKAQSSVISLTQLPEDETLLIGRYVSVWETGENVEDEAVIQGRYDLEFKASQYDLPARGFTTHAIWLRLELAHEGSETENIFLTSLYPILDMVQLFQKDPNGVWQNEKQGDAQNYEHGAPYRFPVLQVKVRPGTNIYYMKIQTTGSSVIALYLARDQALKRFQIRDSATLALLFGVILTLLLYNLFLTFSFRSSTYLYYTLFIGFMAITQFCMQGTGVWLLPGKWGIWSSTIGFQMAACIAYVMAFLMTVSFLNMKQHMPRVRKFYLTCAGLSGLMVPMAFVMNYTLHTKILSTNLFIGALFMMVSSTVAMTRGYRPAFPFSFAWLFMIGNNLLMGLTFEGIIHSPFVIQYSFLPGMACEGILMSLALGERVNFLRAKADRTIHELNEQLQEHLVQVEGLVAERTETIRNIVDNVASGFLMIDREAYIAPGFTRSCYQILSADLEDGMNIIRVLGLKPDLASKFRMALQQIFDDQMPLEASLGQLPSYVLACGKYLHIEAAGVRDQAGTLQHLLLTFTDATELRRRRLEAQRNRSLLKTLRDIDGFRQFVAYSYDAIQKLKQLHSGSEDQASRERLFILHTMKGNCMVFQLPEIARTLHQLEEKDQLTLTDIGRLEGQFKKYLTRHASLLRVAWGPVSYEKKVTDAQLQALRDLARARLAPPLRVEIDHWIQDVAAKPVRTLLHSLLNDARVVARKHGKNVEMSVLDRDARVHSDAEEALIEQLIHVLRNSIIHGIEDDREAAQKPQQGFICLDFRELPDGLAISCSDDGRGFNRAVWEAEWQARGLPMTDDITRMPLAKLVAAVSRGGFSTQEKASLFAGRGIGIEALFSAVERCQGTLELISEPGKGARFEIFIPRSQTLRSAS